MQGNHAIYESKKFKGCEMNHSTRDLEVAVIVHALKMWSHYLLGSKFELSIDHDTVK